MVSSRCTRAVRVGVACLGVSVSLVSAMPVMRAANETPPPGWEEIQREDNVIVYGRTRPGSSIRELRAVGTINAPNWVVKNVLDDTEHYVDFMPNTLESHILSRDPAHHTLITYAKLSAPLISPRDYTLLIHEESKAGTEGAVVYKTRWEATDKAGVAEKSGVTRVKINEGSWTLESIENGAKTRGVYQLYTDGGALPVFILNQATKRRIGELYEAVNKRAQETQYRKTKPVVP